MNKKLVILIVAIVIAIICGSSFIFFNSNENINSNNNIAIVYFSATGNTKEVANYIKDITQGDLIEIIPKEEYTKEDLNYNNDDCRANIEQNDSSSRPEIKNNIDISSYDVIYLGYPIWWGTLPRIIQTFMESSDLNGKTVIPFCTSGGSGIYSSENVLHSYQYDIKWIEGKRLTINKDEIKNWINSLEDIYE